MIISVALRRKSEAADGNCASQAVVSQLESGTILTRDDVNKSLRVLSYHKVGSCESRVFYSNLEFEFIPIEWRLA